MFTMNAAKNHRPAEPAAAEKTSAAANSESPTVGDRRNLLSVCLDLFVRLEESLVTDRDVFFDDYFVTLVKRDEMDMVWVEPTYYQHLKTIIKNEVFPLYDRYVQVRDAILAKREKRQENKLWIKYCLYTIGICELIEAIASGGRSLRPQIFFPTVALEGLLGLGLYSLVNQRDNYILRAAKKKLLHSIREIDTKHDVAARYEIFREYSGGDLLRAELQELLARYPSPAEFWQDYYAVRRADPTNERDLEKLGVARFQGFLELHAKGVYSTEARQQRFNELFIQAHRAFVENNREHYVVRHLAGFKPTR
jgi:hypothetical protein